MDVGRRDLIMECPNVMLTRKRERNSDIFAKNCCCFLASRYTTFN